MISRLETMVLMGVQMCIRDRNRDMPLSEAETIGQEFVELTGAKTLEELRAIPAEKIVELQEEFGRVNASRMPQASTLV